jgi:hypothetical protein
MRVADQAAEPPDTGKPGLLDLPPRTVRNG